MICPKCKSRAIGKIGQNQYYCWDCSIEFVPTQGGVRMYRLEPDGTAMPDSTEGLSGTLLSSTNELQLNPNPPVVEVPFELDEEGETIPLIIIPEA